MFRDTRTPASPQEKSTAFSSYSHLNTEQVLLYGEWLYKKNDETQHPLQHHPVYNARKEWST
jgi:hypothetical protein